MTFKSREDAIEKLKGQIMKGTCIDCNGRNTMVYTDDICFVCYNCGMSCHEDIYYQWIAGFKIQSIDETGD